MIKIFNTRKEYDDYNVNGLPSGNTFYVKEDGSVHFRTNNIDGTNKTFDVGGRRNVLVTKDISKNGIYTPDDADGYSKVNVNVPIPEGYVKPLGNILINDNGEFNVTNYKNAIVDVPVPEGYIYPSGSKDILENGDNINVTKYKYVNVNVPQPQGNINITENGNVDIANYSIANVNVPIPEGYIYPSGTLSVTNNGKLNVRYYEDVDVNVKTSYIEYNTIKSVDKDTQGKYVVPSGVTGIGIDAFKDCKYITGIEISDTVQYIGDDAFSGCESLGYIIIKNPTPPVLGENILGDNEFNLIIYVPTESIEDYKTNEKWSKYDIFMQPISNINKNIIYKTSRIFISEGEYVDLKNINYDAFGTQKISHTFKNGIGVITFSRDVTKIGDKAFADCKYLTNIIIPDSVKEIGQYAFSNCIYLTSIVIPNNVTSISNYAFSGCRRLNNIIIPHNVTFIGDNAFQSCISLTSIEIPNTVTYIGSTPFSCCSDLTSIIVESYNKKYDSRNNCNAIIETATNTLIQGCKNTIIPNTVTIISDDAFRGQSNLTSIVIPNNVTYIGYSVFSGCSKLSNIKISNKVNIIHQNTFSGCTELKDIIIPNSVTYIGDYAFSDCTSLSSIEIPKNLSSMGNSVFYRCYKLNIIIAYPIYAPIILENTFDKISPNGTLYIPKNSLDYEKWEYHLPKEWKISHDILILVGKH